MSLELQARFESLVTECPIVGIFRGLRPDEAIEIGEAAWRAGIRIIEVPMNSPDPLDSIAKLRAHFGNKMIVGGGTITSAEQASALAEAGGQISVSPNCNPLVISTALEAGIIPMPGIATATEAFAAVDAGASYLKLFPASNGGAKIVKALLDVLPISVSIFAVGGVTSSNAREFIEAGCLGLGTGSGVYRAGKTAAEVFEAANAIVNAVKA